MLLLTAASVLTANTMLQDTTAQRAQGVTVQYVAGGSHWGG